MIQFVQKLPFLTHLVKKVFELEMYRFAYLCNSLFPFGTVFYLCIFEGFHCLQWRNKIKGNFKSFRIAVGKASFKA